jgi:hypothetical protein
MAGGRPTEYTAAIAKQAWDYLETYESKYKDAIPSAVGLAAALNRAESTIYAWDAPEKPEFSGILAAIKEKQQQVLLNKGLMGDFNAQITKLVLGKHGYQEKVQAEHSGSINFNDVTDDQLHARIAAIIKP